MGEGPERVGSAVSTADFLPHPKPRSALAAGKRREESRRGTLRVCATKESGRRHMLAADHEIGICAPRLVPASEVIRGVDRGLPGL